MAMVAAAVTPVAKEEVARAAWQGEHMAMPRAAACWVSESLAAPRAGTGEAAWEAC